eukprot:7849767-Prorocentrum_lima.AAC.1
MIGDQMHVLTMREGQRIDDAVGTFCAFYGVSSSRDQDTLRRALGELVKGSEPSTRATEQHTRLPGQPE